jgi:outer membrane protein assembly factor BamD
MNKLIKTSVICLTLIFIAGCSNKKESLAESSYSSEELFKLGSQSLEAGSNKKAKEYFIKINQEYPYSKEAQKAQYLEGLANYNLKDYETAAIALTEYIDLYPAGEEIENAYYLKALCYYDQIIEVRLDQNMAERALDALKALVERFPKGTYTQDVNLKIDLVYDQLAGKEMATGRFYLKKNIIAGAINRFQNVVKEYSTTSYIEEALYRLVECYYTLGITNEAEKYAAILGKNYPSGKWYRMSYSLIKNNAK